MPHSTSALVDRILAATSAGPARADEFGLTLIPLQLGGVPTRPPPRLVWQELEPPSPAALAATNPSSQAVGIPLGQVLTGGMTDRVIAAVTVLPRGTTLVVPAEALSSRWWDGGGPNPAGALSAALTAALLLATSDRIGLRSIARTALWDGYRRPTTGAAVDGSRSWVLLQAGRPLAAHLVAHADLPAPGASPTLEPASLSLVLRALVEAIGTDAVRVVSHHAELVDVWVVEASLDLPEAILAAAR